MGGGEIRRKEKGGRNWRGREGGSTGLVVDGRWLLGVEGKRRGEERKKERKKKKQRKKKKKKKERKGTGREGRGRRGRKGEAK
ncbi:hypothetical protein M0R45_034917 [Rubus argutus]|uniref:Uncharacterized protein n=1 Tax=Rubus argutus TaxID=59490 RepID=A0AAW1VVX5_RUBAR